MSLDITFELSQRGDTYNPNNAKFDREPRRGPRWPWRLFVQENDFVRDQCGCAYGYGVITVV